MWFRFVLLCLFVTSVFGAPRNDWPQWLNFKAEHGKSYESLEEELKRFNIFQNNLRTMEEHNALYEAGKSTFQMGVNRFSDLTSEEFLATLRTRVPNPGQFNGEQPQLRDVTIPDSLDWREKGAVTSVKDQSDCGSCWAFSTTAAIESFYFLKYNVSVDLSPQELVDCDPGSAGCDGGDPDSAMEYIAKHGIAKETSYEYRGITAKCTYNESMAFTKISKHVHLKGNDENALLQAVGTLGPVSVVLDAADLQSYHKGILHAKTCKNHIDHAVLAVGYGHDNTTNTDYWIIKNSWGTYFGENGYFRIKRGTNECGIATSSIYPII